ncbi:hypothetical protein BC936DRAFT_145172 [Jimgerdemannia flammicorona]|uniref:Uncharacterized protein n=1 Tax=Jimgerdemannia flammicorona TaxID=994334 RepID=A0A433DAR0_9FUNG|nr:hypothetical protein BC936DRAFT_145172 [Jimgerdemannia flammicorona]
MDYFLSDTVNWDPSILNTPFDGAPYKKISNFCPSQLLSPCQYDWKPRSFWKRGSWSRTVKSKLRKDDEFSKATLAARNVKDLDAGAEDEQESNILENGDSVHPYAGHNAIVSYLKGHTAWSYTEFLNLYCEVILSSPPMTARWDTLDLTWARRFLLKAEELDPDNFEVLAKKGAPVYFRLD